MELRKAFVCDACGATRPLGVEVPALHRKISLLVCSHCVSVATALLLSTRRDDAAVARAEAATAQLADLRREIDPLRLEVKRLRARIANDPG